MSLSGVITARFQADHAAARSTSWWANIDRTLLMTWAALCALGLLMVVTSSIAIAEKNISNPLHYFERQIAFLMLGIFFGFIATRISLKTVQRCGLLALLAGFVLMVIVLLPGVGHASNGSARWIPLGPVNLQASEVFKLLWVIYLAGFLVRRCEVVCNSIRGILVLSVVLTIVSILLLMQPDFGALFVLCTSFLALLFLGGARIKDFALLFVVMSLLLGAVAVAAPYRLARLMTFIDPWADPFNSGFQLTQSLIAFGRGELFGVGLGNSIQKLFYLPEAHTDFILAVWAEETGLLGVSLIIALYGILIVRGFRVAVMAEKQGLQFGALLAYGIILLIGIGAIINMGVVMGMLPTKGLALPFISYGGSSLVVNCIAFALLLRVDYETRRSSMPVRKRGRV